MLNKRVGFGMGYGGNRPLMGKMAARGFQKKQPVSCPLAKKRILFLN